MENIHDTAKKLGIEKPVLEREEHMEDNVLVSSLTPESEKLWSDYLRSITMARLALNQ